MFLHVSVILFTEGGSPGRENPPPDQAGRPPPPGPGRETPQTRQGDPPRPGRPPQTRQTLIEISITRSLLCIKDTYYIPSLNIESSPDVGRRFVDICCTFTQSTLSLSTLCCTWSGMFAPTCRLLIARSRYVSFRRSMWPCRDLSASCIVYI